MSTLLEVLKDKEARRPIVRLSIYLAFFIVIMFFIGFFAAFAYNAMFPQEYRKVYNSLFGESTDIKEVNLPLE